MPVENKICLQLDHCLREEPMDDIETVEAEKQTKDVPYAESTGQGQPVLLIHGILCDHTFFDGLVEELKADFQLITYDRRGYGLLGGDSSDYSIDVQAEDAFRVLQRCGIRKAAVIGHSAGARVALALAFRHPEAVEKLFLMEPAIGMTEEGLAANREWNRELNGYAAEHKAGKITKAFARITGSDKCGKPKKVSLTKEKLLRAKRNVENFAYGELNDIQLWQPDPDELRAVGCPVFAGVSELGRDELFGRVTLQDMDGLPWTLITIPGGHTSLRDRPEESARILREQFLSKK